MWGAGKLAAASAARCSSPTCSLPRRRCASRCGRAKSSCPTLTGKTVERRHRRAGRGGPEPEGRRGAGARIRKSRRARFWRRSRSPASARAAQRSVKVWVSAGPRARRSCRRCSANPNAPRSCGCSRTASSWPASPEIRSADYPSDAVDRADAAGRRARAPRVAAAGQPRRARRDATSCPTSLASTATAPPDLLRARGSASPSSAIDPYPACRRASCSGRTRRPVSRSRPASRSRSRSADERARSRPSILSADFARLGRRRSRPPSAAAPT